MDIDRLIERFDNVIKQFYVTPPKQENRLNKRSRSYLEKHFGITFPEEFVYFAKHSRYFNCFFGGLGTDYKSLEHIIRINSWCRRRRRTRRIPKNLIAINLGHDEDFNCFDFSSVEHETGQVPIVYWYPGIKKKDMVFYKSFLHFICKNVENWERMK